MIVFPNAKINLALHVINKRADGFHNLETIFYPLPFTDILEFIYLPLKEKFTYQFNQTGLPVEGDSSSNLCIKALQLLKKDLPVTGLLQIHLHKIIPMGAGLGGGSSDGAFTLTALNQLLNIQLNQKQLMEYALQLGSDCPFFIYNKPCLAQQRGDFLTPLNIDLSAFKIIIVNPGIHINTAWAFSNITPGKTNCDMGAIALNNPEDWKHYLTNDFEHVVIKWHPKLAEIKKVLYDAGAVFTSMSGSGSTFYGLFNKKQNLPQLSLPQHYFVKEFEL